MAARIGFDVGREAGFAVGDDAGGRAGVGAAVSNGIGVSVSSGDETLEHPDTAATSIATKIRGSGAHTKTCDLTPASSWVVCIP